VDAIVDDALALAEFTFAAGPLAVSVRLPGLDSTRLDDWLALLDATAPAALRCGPEGRVEADGEGVLTFVVASGGSQVAGAAPAADCRAAILHVAEHAVPPLV
jgi:hypothetical protein